MNLGKEKGIRTALSNVNAFLKADNRIRTGDLFITSESLYLLSHIGL